MNYVDAGVIVALLVVYTIASYVERLYMEMGRFLAREYQENIDAWEQHIEPRMGLKRGLLQLCAVLLVELSFAALVVMIAWPVVIRVTAEPSSLAGELAQTALTVVLPLTGAASTIGVGVPDLGTHVLDPGLQPADADVARRRQVGDGERLRVVVLDQLEGPAHRARARPVAAVPAVDPAWPPVPAGTTARSRTTGRRCRRPASRASRRAACTTRPRTATSRASAAVAQPTPIFPCRGQPMRNPTAIATSSPLSSPSSAASFAVLSRRRDAAATSAEVATRVASFMN